MGLNSCATARTDLFLTASLDGTMRMWDMHLGSVGAPAVAQERRPRGHGPAAALRPRAEDRGPAQRLRGRRLRQATRPLHLPGSRAARQGGLFPTCCRYSPTDAKKMVAGCSDGSVQLFFDKAPGP